MHTVLCVTIYRDWREPSANAKKQGWYRVRNHRLTRSTRSYHRAARGPATHDIDGAAHQNGIENDGLIWILPALQDGGDPGSQTALRVIAYQATSFSDGTFHSLASLPYGPTNDSAQTAWVRPPRGCRAEVRTLP